MYTRSLGLSVYVMCRGEWFVIWDWLVVLCQSSYLPCTPVVWDWLGFIISEWFLSMYTCSLGLAGHVMSG